MKILYARLRNALSWHFFIGRDPVMVPARSIVMFPCRTNFLCCGLAGILVIKGTKPAVTRDDAALMSELWQKICSRPLKDVISGACAAQDYLDPAALAQIEGEIFALKQNPARLLQLMQGAAPDVLGDVCAAMDAFVRQEEARLEKKAASLSTQDIETLTRALIALKDAC